MTVFLQNDNFIPELLKSCYIDCSAAERRQSLATAVRACCPNDVGAFPALIRSASRAFIRSLRNFEQTTPPLRGCPSLLRRGLSRTFGQQALSAVAKL